MSAPQPSPLRVAVIGAGPSGFYATDALLKQREDVSIDLIDRLPTPYGLVRYGVAPDHQKIKSVTKLYERTCADPRVRFLGNVEFGRDLTHEDVRRHYHAVIYAVGAPSDRNLNIPGEDKAGCLSATEFVAWYNGHPDYVGLEVPLDARSVAVIGMGNVAVDVARVLAKSVDELAQTDMADYAVEHLRTSQVTDVYMLGRRGPAEAKFTTKELRELGELANADIVVLPEELEVSEASLKGIEGDATKQKNLEVLREMAAKPLEGKPRRLHIRFCVSPKEVLGDDRISALTLERNRLEPTESGYMQSVGTGELETLEAQLLLRSVGYQGTALPGVPFDARKNVIPNDHGRVLDAPGGAPVAGEYVAGWIKRGPTGVIGTNKADAMETVESLLQDEPPPVDAAQASPAAVDQLLQQRGVRPFGFGQWLALDQHELQAGKAAGRPRVKVTAVEDMLRFAKAEV
ncbi:MAG: FAD-dependent oxidoreductase [Deinococcales bacterium]